MRLSPVKRLILETMWVLDKPAKAVKIAEEVGVNFPSVMMHIIGLTKMRCVTTPEKGFYAITEEGKKALGIPEVNSEGAKQILAYLPAEKSFHFYADVGKPLNVFAASLQDFRDKLSKVGLDSIEFHTNRGDFQSWFAGLGDAELARRIMLIKERKLAGDELLERLHHTVENRCERLIAIRERQASPNSEIREF